MHLFTSDRTKWGWAAVLAGVLLLGRGLEPLIAARVVEWLPFVNVGLVWIWFLGLNLVWFLGAGSTRRSRMGWLVGTPMLLALTGLFVGGTFDGGCTTMWGWCSGLIGLMAGPFVGDAMAHGDKEQPRDK